MPPRKSGLLGQCQRGCGLFLPLSVIDQHKCVIELNNLLSGRYTQNNRIHVFVKTQDNARIPFLVDKTLLVGDLLKMVRKLSIPDGPQPKKDWICFNDDQNVILMRYRQIQTYKVYDETILCYKYEN